MLVSLEFKQLNVCTANRRTVANIMRVCVCVLC